MGLNLSTPSWSAIISPVCVALLKRAEHGWPVVFLKNFGGHAPQTPLLYVPDRANGDFSVIHDSERCVL